MMEADSATVPCHQIAPRTPPSPPITHATLFRPWAHPRYAWPAMDIVTFLSRPASTPRQTPPNPVEQRTSGIHPFAFWCTRCAAVRACVHFNVSSLSVISLFFRSTRVRVHWTTPSAPLTGADTLFRTRARSPRDRHCLGKKSQSDLSDRCTH